MSTVSSGVDLPTKFQKLAGEYAKLRAQIPVLKNAVVDEQTKSRAFEDELRTKDQQIRTLTTESESLSFRNQQLAKRVEFLQERLDETGAATKDSSPVRFFRKPSLHGKLNRQGLSQSISHDHLVSANNGDSAKRALEEELSRKLEENETLNRRVYEIESAHEREVALLKGRIQLLEADATSLRGDLSSIKGRQDAVLAELKSEKAAVQNQLDSTRSEMVQYRKDREAEASTRTDLSAQLKNAQRLISDRVLFDDGLVADWNRLNVPSIDSSLGEDARRLFSSLQPFVVQTLTHSGLFHSYCKQRAQLYPCDTNLGESLSDTNSKYCALLRENANACRSIESAFQTLVDKCRSETGFFELTSDNLSPLFSSCDNYNRFLAQSVPLVRDALDEECATGWCNSRLAEENRAYVNAYERYCLAVNELLVPLESILVSTSDSTSVGDQRVVQLLSAMDQLDKAVKDLCDQFSVKIINEHQLPVATRQLRTTNECVAAALNSASKYAGELCGTLRERQSVVSRLCDAVSRRRPEWTTWRKRAVDYYHSTSSTPFDGDNVDGSLWTATPWRNIKCKNMTDDAHEPQWKLRLEEKEKTIGALEREKEKWILETQLLKMKLEQFHQQGSNAQRCAVGDSAEGGVSIKASEDSAYIEEYYGDRVAELNSQLQDANSRLVFFQTECRNLMKTIQIYQKQKERFHADLRESSQQVAHLKDELDTTRKGYETQLSTLSEHLAQMNQQLTKQTDEIDMLRQAMTDKHQKRNRLK